MVLEYHGNDDDPDFRVPSSSTTIEFIAPIIHVQVSSLTTTHTFIDSEPAPMKVLVAHQQEMGHGNPVGLRGRSGAGRFLSYLEPVGTG